MLAASIRIRHLNDAFRCNLQGGQVFITPSISALPIDEQLTLLEKVQSFDQFDEDNDPYNEHDFAAIEMQGSRYFWKIDYYDPKLECGSSDPADPYLTCRVLTIMCANEY